MNKQEHTDLNDRVARLTKAKARADALDTYIQQIVKAIAYLRDQNYTGCELIGIFLPNPLSLSLSNDNRDNARYVTSTNFVRLAKVTREAFLTELAAILKESQDEYAAIKLPQ